LAQGHIKFIGHSLLPRWIIIAVNGNISEVEDRPV
jgi:hypothetical protein